MLVNIFGTTLVIKNYGLKRGVTKVFKLIYKNNLNKESNYWKGTVSQFKIANKILDKKPIIFLGDSLTERFRVNQFFNNSYVVNRGIGGDTSKGVLKRLKETALNLNPSKIFIMIGTNDIDTGHSSNFVINNYQKILNKIQNETPNALVYIQSISPFRNVGNKEKEKYNKVVHKTNQKLKKLARSYKVKYINIAKNLSNSNGKLKKEVTIDGTHFNGKGYKLWFKQINKYV